MHLHSHSSGLTGHISLSGSKSISNRLLILNAVLKQNVVLKNLSDSEDTKLLTQALQKISAGNSPIIDVNHAGTDFRFLTALLAATPGKTTLTGSERMKQRPVGELVNALRTLGADIQYKEKEGFPPLYISGKLLKGGEVRIRGDISSQFISALLLIAPTFENALKIRIEGDIVSRPYIDMTVAILKSYGILVNTQPREISVQPITADIATPTEYAVESDWSSASYWYSLAALSDTVDLTLDYFHGKSLQADAVLPEIYKSFGIDTTYTPTGIRLMKAGNPVKTFHFDFRACPDIAQTVAVTCLGLGISASFSGLETLKIKETDRIVALKHELEKFGAIVSITDNSLQLTPPENGLNMNLQTIATYHDHRMAMSFAPLCMKTKHLCIDDMNVVDKSYPHFWKDLAQTNMIIIS
ncbi:MAG: 3-phosphoshikimate 1-carboxyvinyltransferase [Bacteroidetes bacterium]|nr:3-phosphoshikimate 1-carboxyvinyltransferase [Bacteroidota bacterium]